MAARGLVVFSHLQGLYEDGPLPEDWGRFKKGTPRSEIRAVLEDRFSKDLQSIPSKWSDDDLERQTDRKTSRDEESR